MQDSNTYENNSVTTDFYSQKQKHTETNKTTKQCGCYKGTNSKINKYVRKMREENIKRKDI